MMNELLLCPSCKSAIPFVIIQGFNVIIECSCKEDIKMSLEELMKSIKTNNDSINSSNKCYKHSDIQGIMYCTECFIWLCQNCLQIHSMSSSCKDHCLLNREINIICSKHSKDFTKYCYTCNSNICSECIPNHDESHIHINLKIIDIEDVYSFTYNSFDSIIAQNNDSTAYLINLINASIQKYPKKIESFTQMKSELIILLENNRARNKVLKQFYQLIYTTAFKIKFKHLFSILKMFDTIKVNNKAVKFEYKTIEDIFISLKNHLENNYIFTQEDSCKVTLTAHSDKIHYMTQLITGEIVSCSYDLTMKIWDKTTFTCQTSLLHKYPVCCCLQLKNKQLISGSIHSVTIWNIPSFSSSNCTLANDMIWCMIQLTNGLLVTGSLDSLITIADIESKDIKGVLLGHSNYVYCLAQLNEFKLASGSKDQTIKIWNLESYECIITLKDHADSVCNLLLLKSGLLLSCSKDKTLKLWNIDSWNCKTIKAGINHFVFSLTQLENEMLASGYSAGFILIWNMKAWTLENVLFSHEDNITCIKQLNSNQLITSSFDNTMKVWNIN